MGMRRDLLWNCLSRLSLVTYRLTSIQENCTLMYCIFRWLLEPRVVGLCTETMKIKVFQKGSVTFGGQFKWRRAFSGMSQFVKRMLTGILSKTEQRRAEDDWVNVSRALAGRVWEQLCLFQTFLSENEMWMWLKPFDATDHYTTHRGQQVALLSLKWAKLTVQNLHDPGGHVWSLAFHFDQTSWIFCKNVNILNYCFFCFVFI